MVKKETKSLGQDPFEDMEGLDWGEAESTADESAVDKAAIGETTTETEAVETDADAEAEAVEPVVEAEAVEAEPVPSATDVPPASGQVPSTTDVPSASEQAPSTSSRYGPSLLALFGISPAEGAASSTGLRSFEPGTKGSGRDLGPDEGPALAQVEAQPETEPVEVAADAEVEPTGELFPLDVDGKDERESELIAPDEETNRFLDELIANIDYQVEQTFGLQAMADSSATAPVDGDAEQHVIFALAGTEYAVPIANVTEIGPPLNVTPLPNVPDWILGVVNLRGDVVSMVDLRAFLGMARTNYGQTSRMLVARARQEDMTAGLIVDRVSGIRFLPMEQIGAPSAAIEDQVAPYLRGVYEHDGRLLVVLDFDKLLLSPEMQQFQPM